MNVLDRKLLREVRASRLLLLAIVSVIAVGVMCFVYMRSAYFNLRLAQQEYYVAGRMADFWVDLKKAPLAELAAVAQLPGVAEIRPRIHFYATVDLEHAPAPLNALVLSLPDRRQPAINDVVLRRGDYFTERRDNEVIVNDAFARHHGVRPGDWIHLVLNNRRQELFVVGTAISCEFVYLVGPGAVAPDPQHFGVFYLKQTFAEEIFDFNGACNQIVGLLAPDVRERPEDILRRIEVLLDPFGVQATTPRHNYPSNRFLSDEIRGLGTFANIMPYMFLAVGALVLNVLTVRLIDQQRVIVGTFKAIGYADGQIFWHFTKFGLVLGLAGGMLGCLAGYGMSNMITNLYRQFFEFPALTNRIYPGTYLAGLAISAACALVGTLQGARAALRLNPAEAMRPKPPPRGGAIWLEHFGWLWGRLSFGWRLTLRNIFRHRLRTTVGVFAGAMGAALLVGGFILQNGLVYMIHFQFELISQSDLDLTLADERSYAALLEAARLPAVDRAEPTLDVACTFVNGPHQRRGGITGLASDARLTVPRDLGGRPIRIPSSGVAMSRKMAELLHLAAGDRVTVRPVKGRRDELSVTVAEISDTYIGLAVYADIEYLSRLIGEELAVTGVQLALTSDPAARHALFRELKQLPSLRSTMARADVIRNVVETVVNTQKIFIGLLVLFAGVIFFASLLNISLIGLAERRREVATLRVLGYTEWQVGGLFLRESMVVNALGTLLGLPLGWLLAYTLTIIYDTEMFRFPMQSPPHVWVQTLILATVFALAAHFFVQRSVSHLDWLDASKTKE